jgi:predicted nucleic acid-binding protein
MSASGGMESGMERVVRVLVGGAVVAVPKVGPNHTVVLRLLCFSCRSHPRVSHRWPPIWTIRRSSARSAADHRLLLGGPPISSMPVEYLRPKIEDRALELQFALAERGHHRAPSIPDLLIAATAELSELAVLHMNKGFELIAELTDQRLQRLEMT